jgi:hypothetical protein
MGDFRKIISKLNEDYKRADALGTADAYNRLSTIFEELAAVLREYIQQTSSEDIQRIIRILKSGAAVSEDDKAKIRLWIVGDADYYTRMENNFEDWKAELTRIIGEIENFSSPDMVLAEALKLQAFLRDGSRVLADLFFYMEQKERVAHFDESTQDIDPEERVILARLLEQKLKSKDF